MPIISSWDKLTSKAKEALQPPTIGSKHGNRELMPYMCLRACCQTAKVWWCRC